MKNPIKIKHYEVLINETAAQCGLIVDLEEYDISFLHNQGLLYEVKNKEKEIHIFSEDNELLIIFEHIDEELIYYSIKTINMAIFGGKLNPETEITSAYFAQLK